MCPGCFHGDSSRAPWLHENVVTSCTAKWGLSEDCVSLPMWRADQKVHTEKVVIIKIILNNSYKALFSNQS